MMAGILEVVRRPVESHGKLKIGVAVVGVIAVALVGALGLGRMGLGKSTYTADFAQAAGLSVGDQITVAGVNVGRVQGLRLDGSHVAVQMEVDDNVPMGRATRASIKLTTLLGARYVELIPAGTGGLTDHRIPLSNTTVPYDLQQSLQDATRTFEAVDAERIAESMTVISDQLEGSPKILPQVLENIEHLSTVIAGRRDQISAMLTSTQRITEMLGSQQHSIGILMTQGRDVLADLVEHRDAIVGLINATTKLVDQLRPILIQDQPAIDTLLTNMGGMLDAVGHNDALLRNTLQLLPVPLRNFTNATGNGNEFDFTSSGGTMIDSIMCAISGRAQQFNLPPYFGDCA